VTIGETAERLIAAFSAADFDAMRGLLAPDLVAWVTGPES
jgi:ketosteroid isomerase-like protein